MNNDDSRSGKKASTRRISVIQQFLLTLVLVSTGTGLYISLMRYSHLKDSAAFYIGLPALLAVLFIMTKPSASPMGATLKGITIALLLSAPLLQEGFLCILFAAPIFYMIGAIIAWSVQWARRRRNGGKMQAHPAIFLLGIFALEGTTEQLSFERDHTVRVERIIESSADAVATRLAQPVAFTQSTPLFLKIFPFPTLEQFDGVNLADRQVLHFVYYKHFVMSAHAGDLVFEVARRGDNEVDWRVVEDTSYISTYLHWQRSTVRWEPVDDRHTRVVWELGYRRKLDPAWYFGPLEYYAVWLTAQVLIENAATPTAAGV